MNTIYDGTYVIGQTSATNFIAGPGIKIDQPSAGTVRIGNDETVLWSGSAVNNSEISLNENFNNFNYIGLEVYDKFGWGYNRTICPTDKVSIAGTRLKRFAASYDFVDPANNNIYRRFFNIQFPNGNYSSCSGFGRGIMTTTAGAITVTNDDTTIVLSKVIGINRISGNA